MPSFRRTLPQRKVGVPTLAGAVVTVGVGIADTLGYTLSPEVASALTVIVTFGLGYVIPPAKST